MTTTAVAATRGEPRDEEEEEEEEEEADVLGTPDKRAAVLSYHEVLRDCLLVASELFEACELHEMALMVVTMTDELATMPFASCPALFVRRFQLSLSARSGHRFRDTNSNVAESRTTDATAEDPPPNLPSHGYIRYCELLVMDLMTRHTELPSSFTIEVISQISDTLHAAMDANASGPVRQSAAFLLTLSHFRAMCDLLSTTLATNEAAAIRKLNQYTVVSRAFLLRIAEDMQQSIPAPSAGVRAVLEAATTSPKRALRVSRLRNALQPGGPVSIDAAHEQFLLAHDLAVALTLEGPDSSDKDAAALLSECIEEHLHPFHDATSPEQIGAPSGSAPPWYTFIAALLADGCRSIVRGTPRRAALFTREYLMGGALLTGNRAMDEVPGIITRVILPALPMMSCLRTALVFSELLLARRARTPPKPQARRASQLDIEAAASTKSLSGGGAAKRRRVRGGGLSVASSSEEMKALAEALALAAEGNDEAALLREALSLSRDEMARSLVPRIMHEANGTAIKTATEACETALAGGAIERDLDLSLANAVRENAPSDAAILKLSHCFLEYDYAYEGGDGQGAHGDDDDERVAPSDADRDRDIAEELGAQGGGDDRDTRATRDSLERSRRRRCVGVRLKPSCPARMVVGLLQRAVALTEMSPLQSSTPPSATRHHPDDLCLLSALRKAQAFWRLHAAARPFLAKMSLSPELLDVAVCKGVDLVAATPGFRALVEGRVALTLGALGAMLEKAIKLKERLLCPPRPTATDEAECNRRAVELLLQEEREEDAARLRRARMVAKAAAKAADKEEKEEKRLAQQSVPPPPPTPSSPPPPRAEASVPPAQSSTPRHLASPPPPASSPRGPASSSGTPPPPSPPSKASPSMPSPSTPSSLRKKSAARRAKSEVKGQWLALKEEPASAAKSAEGSTPTKAKTTIASTLAPPTLPPRAPSPSPTPATPPASPSWSCAPPSPSPMPPPPPASPVANGPIQPPPPPPPPPGTYEAPAHRLPKPVDESPLSFLATTKTDSRVEHLSEGPHLAPRQLFAAAAPPPAPAHEEEPTIGGGAPDDGAPVTYDEDCSAASIGAWPAHFDMLAPVPYDFDPCYPAHALPAPAMGAGRHTTPSRRRRRSWTLSSRLLSCRRPCHPALRRRWGSRHLCRSRPTPTRQRPMRNGLRWFRWRHSHSSAAPRSRRARTATPPSPSSRHRFRRCASRSARATRVTGRAGSSPFGSRSRTSRTTGSSARSSAPTGDRSSTST